MFDHMGLSTSQLKKEETADPSPAHMGPPDAKIKTGSKGFRAIPLAARPEDPDQLSAAGAPTEAWCLALSRCLALSWSSALSWWSKKVLNHSRPFGVQGNPKELEN